MSGEATLDRSAVTPRPQIRRPPRGSPASKPLRREPAERLRAAAPAREPFLRPFALGSGVPRAPASTSSAARPSCSRVCLTAASPKPRPARARARPAATRASSTRPTRSSAARASARASSPAPRASEPLLETAAGEIAVPKRTNGNAERLGAAELAGEGPGGLPVERAPDGEARAHDRVGGNDPPRHAVELDLDAAARPFPQRRDLLYGDYSSAAPTSASAAAAAAAFAALPAGSAVLGGFPRLRSAGASPRRPAPDRSRAGSAGGSLRHVGMLPEERGRVLAPLAQPLVAEAEVRARLRDDLPLGGDVDDRAFPREAGAVR